MPEKKTPPPKSTGEEGAAPGGRSRRRALTPEQRRLLDQPRSLPNEPASLTPREPAALPPSEQAPPLEEPPASSPEKAAGGMDPQLPQEQTARVIELQQAILILGAILLAGLTFYAGAKFNYLKYLITSRNAAPITGREAEQFPGVAAEDLVAQGLADENAGKWQEALDRYMAAKRKDLRYRGILFQAGKILYDHRNFASADAAFERALAFGEDVGASNFYRGLIAIRQRDLTAAEVFFAAAVKASPFVPDYYYYWGETLRLDRKPKESFPQYEQAILLVRAPADEAVYRFKIRMGKIEAGESVAVQSELAKREAAGLSTVDWLMTAAALQLKEGHVEDARQSILRARRAIAPALFASCVNDFHFQGAAEKYPALAEALQLDFDLQAPFSN